MRFFTKLLSLLLLIVPSLGWAQVIADRTTLNAIVGAKGTSVDFQSFSGMGSGESLVISGVPSLDSSTIINSQGPNLVPGGVVFVFANSGDLQWNDAGYYNAPSREIISNHNPLEIHFNIAAAAFGLDLRAYAGFGATATVTIYATDKTTILSTIPNLNLASSGVPIFFGYQAASGIGKVVLTNSGQSWSPIIDNLTFTVIPEPPAYALLAGGLAFVMFVRRRSSSVGAPCKATAGGKSLSGSTRGT